MRTFAMAAFLFMGIVFTLLPIANVQASCEPAKQKCCGNVATSIIQCDQDGGDKIEETGVWGILIIAINILIAGVGVLALAGIIYGSVLYTSAGGSAEQVKKAMGIFTNVVIGVLAFAAMWVLLNFLVPGGAFTNLP